MLDSGFDYGGRLTVDCITGASPDSVMCEIVLQSKILPEAFEIPCPHFGGKRLRRRCNRILPSAGRGTENRNIQHSRLPLHMHALFANGDTVTKNVFNVLHRLSGEGLIDYGQRQNVIEETEHWIVFTIYHKRFAIRLLVYRFVG